MRIQTRGNSNVVWLSSETGVISGTMSLSAPALERILQAVNEKYGTSFEGWSQLPTAYEVGDTVTDWNAYEKILKQLEDGLYKYDLSHGYSSAFVCMEIHNGIVDVYASSLEIANNLNVYNPDGTYWGAYGTVDNFTEISQICSRYPNFVSISRSVKDNANLENWGEYTLLS